MLFGEVIIGQTFIFNGFPFKKVDEYGATNDGLYYSFSWDVEVSYGNS